MTTRLYYSLDPAAPLVSPAFDAAWDRTLDAVRRNLEGEKIDPPEFAPANHAVVSGTTNSPAGAADILMDQYISGPLSGPQTISGAISGYMRVAENSGAADLRSQMVVRVVSNDGSTVRGTLIAANNSALASEWGTTAAQRKMPLGTPVTPTSVAALDGDRIVVEVGYRKHENATTSRTGTVTLGALRGGTDAAANETDTALNVPWIEFTDTLVFQSVLKARVSQAVGQAFVVPTTQQARITQVAALAFILPTAARRTAYMLDTD